MISLHILRAAEELLQAGDRYLRLEIMEESLDAAAEAVLWGEWDEPDLRVVAEWQKVSE